MQHLKSFLFNVILWLSVLPYALAALLTFPLPFRARFRFISGWARMQLWLVERLCGLNCRVVGREHIPAGPAIILAKHQSTWETIAMQTIFPPQTWVLKRELMWAPLFGWALAMLKPIAIDRGAGRKAVEQLVVQGKARLAEGIWVVVFPEGTRVAPGARRRYGLGGAVLAAESGYPVVPVAHNAGSFWPRRGFLKKPGTIQVAIGPTIDPSGKSAEQIIRAAEEWIESAMSRFEARN